MVNSTALNKKLILPITLTVLKTDAWNVDAYDQWCLRMLLGIKWHQFVQNDEVQRLTGQLKPTAIVQSRLPDPFWVHCTYE